ncbi:MAG: hypothetical protein ABIG61_00900 [Planctomycetota bacterium]
MAVEATYCRYRKTNFKIAVIVLIGLALVFAYDGYVSKYEWSMRHKFYREHVVNNNNKPDSDMIFNQRVPFFLAAAGVIAVIWFAAVKNKKIEAREDAIVLSDNQAVPYGSITSVDKTFFDSKGYFTLNYKDQTGREKQVRLSRKTYDGLGLVLDELVRKIS